MSAITRGAGTMVSSTVGTTATATAVISNTGRNFLQIQNVHASQSLAYTLDGTAPVINGNGFTLTPSQTSTFDVWVPTGLVTVVGSGVSTSYSILWG
jgi:hypothetical protein